MTTPSLNKAAETKPQTTPDSQTPDFIHGGPKEILLELFRRYNADQIGVWAASLSFFALLSIVPILVGGIALLGFLIRDPQEAANQIQGFVAQLLPLSNAREIARRLIVSTNIEEQARKLMESRGWAGLISLGTFLFTASRIFINAMPPMNVAFRAEETRNLIQINLHAVRLLIGTALLFLLSLLPTYGMHFLRQIPVFSGLPDPSPWWLGILLLLVGFGINVITFTLIYRYLPSPKAGVTWEMALVGGGIVAILWELLKQGFALYLRNFGGGDAYDRTYGSLGGAVALILWIYFSAQLLLLGAEISRLYMDRKEARSGGKP